MSGLVINLNDGTICDTNVVYLPKVILNMLKDHAPDTIFGAAKLFGEAIEMPDDVAKEKENNMDEPKILFVCPAFRDYLYDLNPDNKIVLTEWRDKRQDKWQLLLCENYLTMKQHTTFIGTYPRLDFAENAIKALRSLLH